MLIHFLNINDYIKNDYIAQIGIKSWRKYMPEHQIKIWTENDDFIKNILNDENNNIIKQCLNKNNFYVYEYIRLRILYEFGGIFAEPDFIILEHIDIQNNDEFFHNLTYHTDDFRNLGLYFAPIIIQKNNILIKMLLNYLENDFKFEKRVYSEFEFCSIKYIKNNQDFEENLKLISFKTICFQEKSLITDKVIHFYDWFTQDTFKTIFIFSEEKHRDFYSKVCQMANKTEIGNYQIFLDNPKIAKLQIAYLKYIIFNNQKVKERILDIENLLGDLDKISPKDWEILNDI